MLHRGAILFLLMIAAVGSPVSAQSPVDYSHFWFLVDLARCDTSPCVVVSSVSEQTASRPTDQMVRTFQSRAESRFHGVQLQPAVEPVGSRWRDEVAALRDERVAGWRRLGWTVYEVDVPDQPTPERLLPARAEAEAVALAAGFLAESRGDLGLALLWYRRALELEADGLVAHRGLRRVEARLRERADAGG